MQSNLQPNAVRLNEPVCDLGILLVHGIGDQAKGATLVQFGTPLYEWLAERAEAFGGKVRVNDAVVTSAADVPAHAEFHLEVQGVDRCWLLAEAWWADSFAAPRFSDFARWGLEVAPRTFGSHFGVALARAWRSPKVTVGQHFTRVGRVAVAFINLIVGMALTFLMLVFLLALLIIGLIPIRRLRETIVRVQLRLASLIGDCYVLVARPIESAAILGSFVRSLDWLESRCPRVAIVAHSQGGAVACLALLNLPGSSNRLLITFGSGLRKLQELFEVRKHPSLRRGALLTVIGFVLAAVTVFGFPNLLHQVHTHKETLDTLFFWALWSAVGWTILIAGIRDFIIGIEPERLKELGRDLSEKVSGWTDLYASADPVPNGPLHDEERVAPFAIPVVNLLSIFRDHTSYWRNHDEFVTRLADVLLRFDGALAEMFLNEDQLDFLGRRRAARVNHLCLSWWVTVAFAIALPLRYPAEWAMVLSWASRDAEAGIMKALGLQSEINLSSSGPSTHDYAFSLGLLALVMGASAIARAVWRIWNRVEMHDAGAHRVRSQYLGFLSALYLLLVVGGSTLFGDLSFWIFYGSLAVIPVSLFVPAFSAPQRVIDAEKERPVAEARAERAAEFLWKLVSAIGNLLVFPIGAFLMVSAIHSYLGRWLPAGKRGWLAASLALGVAVMLLVFVLHIVATLRRRFRKSSSR